MSSHNEQIQPKAFDVAPPGPEEQPTAAGFEPAPARPSWVLPALLGLALVAVLVVFWLPGRIGPAEVEPISIEETSAAPPAVQKRADQAPPEASPWSDAQLARQRKEAQDVLADLLEIQELLEQTNVELWAAEPFEAAKLLATEADRQYRDRQFQEALVSYQQGQAAMQAILESTDDVLNEHLERGRLAIEALDPAAAEEALAIAEAIEPGSAELARLSARASALEPLSALLREAGDAEQVGNLAGAETALGKATELDPVHLRAAAELARVSAAHTAMRFNDAMSDGYLALDERRFDDARKAFKSAERLVPGSNEAASALLEVQTAQTAARLSSLEKKGAAAESAEKWSEATEYYGQALAIDPDILYAQEGFARASKRAKLDQQFTGAITKPGRLSDKAVAEATEALLRQAATIAPRGPVLDKQIRELEVLLQQANTPLSLTLESDGLTHVTIYKVARLGQFERQQLTLRPGKYTAVGTRNGFRDVRVNFDLSHDTPPGPVVVRCTDPV